MIYTSLMIFFLSLLPEKIPMGDSRAGFAGNFRSECDTAEQEKGELRHIQFEFFKTFSSPLFFIMCSRVSIRCPAAPVAVLYLPFCRCPRSCAPAGDHPTPYPRASAPLLSVLAPAFPPGSSDPASPRFRTSSLCPASALPPGTIRPRIPALPHLFSLSSLLRSRRGPPTPHPRVSTPLLSVPLPRSRRGPPTPHPRVSTPLLSVPLSRSRRGPPAVRPSPSLPRKILPGIPERIFREQSSVHTVFAPLLLWFWWLLRRNVTALRPTDSVPNQSARVCRLRR